MVRMGIDNSPKCRIYAADCLRKILTVAKSGQKKKTMQYVCVWLVRGDNRLIISASRLAGIILMIQGLKFSWLASILLHRIILILSRKINQGNEHYNNEIHSSTLSRMMHILLQSVEIICHYSKMTIKKSNGFLWLNSPTTKHRSRDFRQLGLLSLTWQIIADLLRHKIPKLKKIVTKLICIALSRNKSKNLLLSTPDMPKCVKLDKIMKLINDQIKNSLKVGNCHDYESKNLVSLKLDMTQLNKIKKHSITIKKKLSVPKITSHSNIYT